MCHSERDSLPIDYSQEISGYWQMWFLTLFDKMCQTLKNL